MSEKARKAVRSAALWLVATVAAHALLVIVSGQAREYVTDETAWLLVSILGPPVLRAVERWAGLAKAGLVLLVFVLGGLTTVYGNQPQRAVAAAASVGNCDPSGWPAAREDLEREVLALVNQHRRSIGAAPFALSGSLQASARWKARHMAHYAYMGHNDPAPPVARTVAQRLEACGYPASGSTWGENVAYGYASARAVVDGWLASPGHRANIENPAFTAIGIGAAESATGLLFWAQNFGVNTGPPPPAPPVTAPPPSDCATGGRADRAKCNLRAQALAWRAAGWSWTQVRATPEWRAYTTLGGR